MKKHPSIFRFLAGAEALSRSQMQQVMGGQVSDLCTQQAGTELICQCLTNYRTFTCDDTAGCFSMLESVCGDAGAQILCARRSCPQ